MLALATLTQPLSEIDGVMGRVELRVPDGVSILMGIHVGARSDLEIVQIDIEPLGEVGVAASGQDTVPVELTASAARQRSEAPA